MRHVIVFILFMSTVASAQPLTIKIDEITTTNSKVERKYAVDFTIANTSTKPISFFLNPKYLIPAQSGSMANGVFFKIFEANEPIASTRLLSLMSYDDPETTGAQMLVMDSITKASYAEIDKLIAKHHKQFMESLMTIAPGESRSYSQDFYWNYERYQKMDELEYYIDSAQPHYLQLSVIFLKEEYKSKVSPEQFTELMAIPTLIKGWFVSNKMEIDFGE